MKYITGINHSPNVASDNFTEGIKRVVFHPVFLAIWCGICLIVSISLWRTTLKVGIASQRLQEATSRVSEEEKRGFVIIDELNEADTPYAREKIIRDELNMQKPGETVIQLPK